jgi:hypothetical protein
LRIRPPLRATLRHSNIFSAIATKPRARRFPAILILVCECRRIGDGECGRRACSSCGAWTPSLSQGRRPRSRSSNPNSCPGAACESGPRTTRQGFLIMQDSIIGVDISKDCLDGFDPGRGRTHRFANNPAGFAALARLAGKRSACAVFEVSGGYERGLTRALAAAGVNTRRVNPRRVRDFAKAAGVLAKTDRIDARLIAEALPRPCSARVLAAALDRPGEPRRTRIAARKPSSFEARRRTLASAGRPSFPSSARP